MDDSARHRGRALKSRLIAGEMWEVRETAIATETQKLKQAGRERPKQKQTQAEI